MGQLTDLSIAEAGALLRTRGISAAELTRQTLAQIRLTEPTVEAYATVMEGEAGQAARVADTELHEGRDRGPLHGIPIAVKDLCDVAGVPTDGGALVPSRHPASADSFVVRRLREGGAIIVGKTVTSEFAFGPTLAPTCNPWGFGLSPEGSSAGSAVAVASRSAFGAVGTDTAGSIRAPAGVNGIVGLKPTFGLVSTSGVIPMSGVLDHVGPMARSVADCSALLGGMAGYDNADPHSRLVGLSSYRAAPDALDTLRDVRLGIDRTYLPDPGVDATASEALEEVARTLAGLGADLVEIALPELSLVEAAIVTIKAADAAAYHLPRLIRDATKYAQQTRVIIQAGGLISAVRYQQAMQARALIARAVRLAFAQHQLDAILAPGWGPPKRQADEPEIPFSFPMRPNAVNLVGIPALNIPCGFTKSGTPLGGFELWGPPLSEKRLFDLGATYEAINNWHRRVPPLAKPAGLEPAPA